MPHIILGLLILLGSFSAWSRCGDFTRVAELLDTPRFLQASRATRGEISVNLADVSQAKSLAYNFPAFQSLGFGQPGRNWTPYNSRLSRSSLHGRRVGWETSTPNGHARVRLDWDPNKGAHYNIEIRQTVNGRSETHKLAVGFKCQGRPCSEDEVTRIAERME